MQTHYDTLFVTNTASQKLIERAYRTLSQEYHPDKNPEIDREKYTELQKELNIAYEVISDPVKRKGYDDELQFSGDRDSIEQYQPSPNSDVTKHDKSKSELKNNTNEEEEFDWLMWGSLGGIFAMLIKHFFL